MIFEWTVQLAVPVETPVFFSNSKAYSFFFQTPDTHLALCQFLQHKKRATIK
ncbi:MAG: hypothetical protein ACJAX3_000082 [Patiriisocius sp.]|jgi:hypothetical protein